MNTGSLAFIGVKSVYRNNVVIGCGSLDKARGKSRNTARYAAFPILATSFGGSDGMAYAMPVTLCVPPVFHTHSSCRPMWKWIGSCSKAQLDLSMSKNLHKVCKKCGGTEFYANGRCKSCARARASAYREANPEKVKESMAAWAACNVDKRKVDGAAYRSANFQKIKEAESAWKAANRDKVNAAQAAWRKANPERNKLANANWSAKNKDAVKTHGHNRRAKARSSGSLSKGLTKKLYKLQSGKCPCCGLHLGNDYHLDHIVPLALGGLNVDSNMQLLRSVCNLQKNKKHPVDFMQSRGFLL